MEEEVKAVSSFTFHVSRFQIVTEQVYSTLGRQSADTARLTPLSASLEFL